MSKVTVWVKDVSDKKEKPKVASSGIIIEGNVRDDGENNVTWLNGPKPKS